MNKNQELLNGAMVQASELKEKIIKAIRQGPSMDENERFVFLCHAINELADIDIKLNTLIRLMEDGR